MQVRVTVARPRVAVAVALGLLAKLGFEGGQMPLQRRLPKFGFTNLKRVEFKAINLSTLEELAAKKSLSEITVDTLVAAGFISSNDKVKILGNGTVTKALSVKAHAFSKSAEAAIVAAGGSVEKTVRTLETENYESVSRCWYRLFSGNRSFGDQQEIG